MHCGIHSFEINNTGQSWPSGCSRGALARKLVVQVPFATGLNQKISAHHFVLGGADQWL